MTSSDRLSPKDHRKWWKTLLVSAALGIGALSLQGCLDDDDDDDDVAEETLWTPSDLAETRYGQVQGSLDEAEDMLVWRGIPYAAPPVGDLRFAPPEAPAQWSDVLTTNEFGLSCTQPASTFGTATSGEDCLFLNVYSPNEAGEYPVMVWIHGGAFETGSGDVYLPGRLVDKDVVVVTVNYRLGIMGFLAHPALSAEPQAAASGDYGLMDQQAALRWVQDNIENFGGNPDNVTIFGESAGGHSVLSQMISPESEGLFHKVIIQSGSYQPGQRSLADAEAQGEVFATGLGCTTVECLRDLEVTEIQAAQAAAGLDFLPNQRPDLLPLSIAEALESGAYSQVPVIEGTNRDEWRLFVGIAELTRAAIQGKTPAEVALTEADYVPTLASTLGITESAAQDIADSLYPLANYENPSIAVGAVGTDAIFACNGLAQVETLSGTVPTYAYEFADRDAPSIIGISNSFDLGAAHAFEIQYVFGSEASWRERGMTEAQISLANAMVDYWTRFAHTGDPNSESGTGIFWPRYVSGADATFMSLVPPGPQPLPSADFAADHKCQFWATQG